MPSTSVHFPRGLIEELDRIASKRQVSRNRLIVETCLELVNRRESAWPDDFFSNERLTTEDLAELQQNAASFDSLLRTSRRSRSTTPF